MIISSSMLLIQLREMARDDRPVLFEQQLDPEAN
jgi:hypothetical protein